jgi:hypothetical protein
MPSGNLPFNQTGPRIMMPLRPGAYLCKDSRRLRSVPLDALWGIEHSVLACQPAGLDSRRGDYETV